jgi:hypothetical protein
MFSADAVEVAVNQGLAGPLGRGALLVGVIASAFGAVASIYAARESSHHDEARTARLIPRFAALVLFAAFAAITAMEYAMITRDFSLQYVVRVPPQRCTTSLQCGALSRGPSCCGYLLSRCHVQQWCGGIAKNSMIHSLHGQWP